MADAPLKRDEQIELMRTAKERHEQHVARWKADPQVQDVLRMPPPSTPATFQASSVRMRVARCA